MILTNQQTTKKHAKLPSILRVNYIDDHLMASISFTLNTPTNKLDQTVNPDLAAPEGEKMSSILESNFKLSMYPTN